MDFPKFSVFFGYCRAGGQIFQALGDAAVSKILRICNDLRTMKWHRQQTVAAISCRGIDTDTGGVFSGFCNNLLTVGGYRR
jgi:hypothetical protein